MILYLSKISKREKMKKISLIAVMFLLALNVYAIEENIGDSVKIEKVEDIKELNDMRNIDKLDVLDQQSKEFFNAITGLEKDYLEEQIESIQNKKSNSRFSNNRQVNGKSSGINEVLITPEAYEKNVFTHQNEMARLTSDFTRTKQLKDLKIKSMYSFNDKNYVVLELSKASARNNTELSANIEGRYIKGDVILGHKIVAINTRTKSVELYKKLDEDFGYSIYLNNYGISVSKLKEIVKDEEKRSNNKTTNNNTSTKKKTDVKSLMQGLDAKDNSNDCRYIVDIHNLNVRNDNNLNARILRVLKQDDEFTIQKRVSKWVLLDTIYKKKSGDVMNVSNKNNWLQIIDDNVTPLTNCN